MQPDRAQGWLSVADIPSAARLGGSRTAVDLALAVGLFAVAFAVRWPYHGLVPRYTDEVRLITRAVRVAEGDALPLSLNGYQGPQMIYLLALAHKLAPDVDTPRRVAVLLGSLSVVLLYAHGRVLSGRLAGVVSAGLFAFSFTPIVVYSHLAWSIGLAVCMQLVAWWLVALAEHTGRGRFLALAGFAMGVATSGYPLLIVSLPGLLIWLALRPNGRRLLRSRFALLALLLMGLAWAPLAFEHGQAMATGRPLSLTGSTASLIQARREIRYLDGVGNALHGVVDGLSASGHAPHWPHTADPLVALALALTMVALMASARAGQTLPLYLTLSGFVLLPLLVRQAGFPLGNRYYGLLLPALYLAAGLAIEQAWRSARETGRAGHTFVALAGMAAAAVLGLGSAARVAQYYQAEDQSGRTNRSIRSLIVRARGAEAPILLDTNIQASFPGGGRLSKVAEALLRVQGNAVERVESAHEAMNVVAELCGFLAGGGSPRSPMALVGDGSLAAWQAAGIGLRRSVHAPPGADGEGYGLYRVACPDASALSRQLKQSLRTPRVASRWSPGGVGHRLRVGSAGMTVSP